MIKAFKSHVTLRAFGQVKKIPIGSGLGDRDIAIRDAEDELDRMTRARQVLLEQRKKLSPPRIEERKGERSGNSPWARRSSFVVLDRHDQIVHEFKYIYSPHYPEQTKHAKKTAELYLAAFLNQTLKDHDWRRWRMIKLYDDGQPLPVNFWQQG